LVSKKGPMSDLVRNTLPQNVTPAPSLTVLGNSWRTISSIVPSPQSIECPQRGCHLRHYIRPSYLLAFGGVRSAATRASNGTCQVEHCLKTTTLFLRSWVAELMGAHLERATRHRNRLNCADSTPEGTAGWRPTGPRRCRRRRLQNTSSPRSSTATNTTFTRPKWRRRESEK